MLTHFVFTDNIWLLANDGVTIRKMAQSLTDVMNSRFLVWKESDLKIMSTSLGGTSDFQLQTIDENFQPCKMTVKAVDRLDVLGSKFTEKGDTAAAMDHRFGKAFGTIHKYKEVLTNESVCWPSKPFRVLKFVKDHKYFVINPKCDNV